MATLSISAHEAWGSIPVGRAFIFFCFSYVLFAFRREVAHLTWSRSFGTVGECSKSLLFSPFGFYDKVLFNEIYFLNNRVIFSTHGLGVCFDILLTRMVLRQHAELTP